MAKNWLNGDIHKLEGILKIDEGVDRPIDTIINEAKKKKLIPKNAVITGVEQTSKHVRIKYVVCHDKISGKKKTEPKREVMIRANLSERPAINQEIKEVQGIITGEETTDKFYRVRFVIL